MEITEIMVSFWVSYNGVPHRIEKINGNDIVLDKNPDNTESACISVGVEEVQPICLTDAILKEAGFFGVKEKYMYGNGQDCLFVTKNDDETWSMSISLHNVAITMKYVHELQMALKSYKRTDIIIDLHRNNNKYNEGNWISIGGEPYKIVRYSVEDPGFVFVIHSNVDEHKEVAVGDIEPLKIGDKFFEYNSFTLKDGKHSLETENYEVSYNNDELWHIRNKVTNEFYDGYLYGVHHLQNVLKMLRINIYDKIVTSEIVHHSSENVADYTKYINEDIPDISLKIMEEAIDLLFK